MFIVVATALPLTLVMQLHALLIAVVCRAAAEKIKPDSLVWSATHSYHCKICRIGLTVVKFNGPKIYCGFVYIAINSL